MNLCFISGRNTEGGGGGNNTAFVLLLRTQSKYLKENINFLNITIIT